MREPGTGLRPGVGQSFQAGPARPNAFPWRPLGPRTSIGIDTPARRTRCFSMRSGPSRDRLQVLPIPRDRGLTLRKSARCAPGYDFQDLVQAPTLRITLLVFVALIAGCAALLRPSGSSPDVRDAAQVPQMYIAAYRAGDADRIASLFGPEATFIPIGLALVRQLVELHDGTVEVSSQGPGRGSTFVVRLPLLAQAAMPPRLRRRSATRRTRPRCPLLEAGDGPCARTTALSKH